jgi:hypothetical protein
MTIAYWQKRENKISTNNYTPSKKAIKEKHVTEYYSDYSQVETNKSFKISIGTHWPHLLAYLFYIQLHCNVGLSLENLFPKNKKMLYI